MEHSPETRSTMAVNSHATHPYDTHVRDLDTLSLLATYIAYHYDCNDRHVQLISSSEALCTYFVQLYYPL